MKSLDINTASANLSAYNSRQFLIEFTGGNFTERLQGTTTHTVIVPYSSLSRKLQTIQRLGSKIINVSIHHNQLQVLKVDPENANPEQINEPILEVHHEISPKETPKQSVAETLESEVVEVDEITSEAFPEPILQTITEITSKEVSDANLENVSASPQVVTSKKKKAVSESTTSSKKTKASTKTSQEVSKQDSNPQVQEPIAIAETTTVSEQVSEQVSEPEPEIVAETISAIIPETSLKPISEETSPTPPKTESQEPSAPLAKVKAPRNSSKSGHGFNKPKSDTKSPRAPKQPKS